MKNELDNLPENQIVWMQRWEESERGWGVREDGMSLHLTVKMAEEYIESQYCDRNDSSVPDEYTRTDGKMRQVEVLSAELYNQIVDSNGTIRTYNSLYIMTEKNKEIKLI